MKMQINTLEPKLLEEVVLVTDGGCRPNPGIGAIGFIIYDRGGHEIWRGSKRIGETTNNQAEYRALIYGLENAAKYTRQRVFCFLDSQLVVKQAKREIEVNKFQILILYEELKEKERFFKEVNYGRLSKGHPQIIKVDALVKEALGI